MQKEKHWSGIGLIGVKYPGKPFYVCTRLAILTRANFKKKNVLKNVVKQTKFEVALPLFEMLLNQPNHVLL